MPLDAFSLNTAVGAGLWTFLLMPIAGAATTSSLWWEWIAPRAGLVRLSTDGSTYDTVAAVFTGSTLNGTRTWAGWASYFLDHSSVLPGRPSTELSDAERSKIAPRISHGE